MEWALEFYKFTSSVFFSKREKQSTRVYNFATLLLKSVCSVHNVETVLQIAREQCTDKKNMFNNSFTFFQADFRCVDSTAAASYLIFNEVEIIDNLCSLIMIFTSHF